MIFRALRYTGVRLDRAAAARKDPNAVMALLELPETRIVPVWRSRNLILGLDGNSERPMPGTYAGAAASRIVAAGAHLTFLGLDSEIAVFAADLSSHDETQAMQLIDDGEFVDLRRAGPLMEAGEAALMAYARGMLHWHQNHRYCSRCVHATESRQAGHMRFCPNPDCGRETYPRTDPAVIMLVEHRASDGIPRCLLGHNPRLPKGVYTTLAGFVEPGESLEEAVAREVFEETAIRVRSVTYRGSQPWPFPSSIMLGFRAEAESAEITIDPDELTDAQWFTADEVRGFAEWADETAPFRLPRKDSIARVLVDSWLAEV